jgi:DNA polymerase (family 10)
VAGKTEAECLEALGIPYVPPELREDIGEAEIFERTKEDLIHKVSQLIDSKNICGDLHVHSTYSDGRNTLAEMAKTAQTRGYTYLAVCDHSPRLRVAGGVSVENLKKKKKEVDELNAKFKGFRLLFGTEVEIDSDGNLDYTDSILKDFDIVIAAVHSGLEQPGEKLTQRIIKACQNKYVHIIAHPTGVHLGKREPCDIDLKEICKAAVETNTFLEINAFPHRLDLNSHNIYFAKSWGVRFAINTDSHSTNHMDYMRLGVGIARRGWLSRNDVLNTMPLKKMLKALKK